MPDPAFADRMDDDGENGENEDVWLYVDALGSRTAYRGMEHFAADEAPPEIADQLYQAIAGRCAFSRLRRRLDDRPDVTANWRVYSDERWLGRARAWLADAGYRCVPPSERQDRGSPRP